MRNSDNQDGWGRDRTQLDWFGPEHGLTPKADHLLCLVATCQCTLFGYSGMLTCRLGRWLSG